MNLRQRVQELRHHAIRFHFHNHWESISRIPIHESYQKSLISVVAIEAKQLLNGSVGLGEPSIVEAKLLKLVWGESFLRSFVPSLADRKLISKHGL